MRLSQPGQGRRDLGRLRLRHVETVRSGRLPAPPQASFGLAGGAVLGPEEARASGPAATEGRP